MKKALLSIIAIVIAHSSFAQWTTGTNINNTNTGNVGIGTTSPLGKLDVRNSVYITNTDFVLNSTGSTIRTYLGANSGNTYGIIETLNSGALSYGNTVINPSGGNVGIGTTNPVGKLDVFDGNGTGVISYFGAYNIANSKGLYLSRPTVNTNPVNIQGTQASVGAADISFQAEGGNVGIGTSNPATILDVDGGINKGKVKVDGTSALAQLKFYRWSGSGGSYNSSAIVTDQNSSGGSILKFQTASGSASIPGSETLNTQMVIDGSGNVGIGTTTPREALSVNGKIRSQEVKVEITNWPDFVFKPQYTLPSLLEVENYIDQNHHLPDMPSEQDVKDNGLNLGEINKILTKKVEELTLYLIEKDKQLKAQETRLKKLEDQFNALTPNK